MNYPLPGETVVRTLRNVLFGPRYSADELAPRDVEVCWHAFRSADLEADAARTRWMRHGDHLAWHAYCDNYQRMQHRYNDLLRLMYAHKSKSYVVDNYRIRLVVEPEGCRRCYLDIREFPR